MPGAIRRMLLRREAASFRPPIAMTPASLPLMPYSTRFSESYYFGAIMSRYAASRRAMDRKCEMGADIFDGFAPHEDARRCQYYFVPFITLGRGGLPD